MRSIKRAAHLLSRRYTQHPMLMVRLIRANQHPKRPIALLWEVRIRKTGRYLVVQTAPGTDLARHNARGRVYRSFIWCVSV